MKYLSPIAVFSLTLLVTSCYYHDLRVSELPAQGADTRHNFAILTPRVIASNYDGPVLLEMHYGDAYGFVLDAIWNESIPLSDIGTNGDKVANDQIYSVTLDSKKILSKVAANTNKVNVGSIMTNVGRYNIFLEIANADVPNLTPQKINSFVQKTPHLVNISTQGSVVSPDYQMIAKYTQTFYQHFSDDYDFIAIIFPGYGEGSYHQDVHQTVSGLGKYKLDISSSFGSAGKLQGINVFPNTLFFDGASVGYQRELGHQWMNFLNSRFLDSSPGWPISDLANSVMGYSRTNLSFQFNLIPQDVDSWKLVSRYDPPVFNDLELYLMGLQPISTVGEHFVFNNQVQTIAPNAIIHGPVTKYTANDIVAMMGARNPGYDVSSKKFRIATIIVSNQLLSNQEMSYYDFMSARAELKEAVTVSEGFSFYLSKPFYLSTGGKGEITTSID